MEHELARTKDQSNKLAADTGFLRRDNERITNENSDLRKTYDYNSTRNQDLAAQIREAEERVIDKEGQLIRARKEVEYQ